MNLPNFLTVFRILITFVFIVYLQKPEFNAKCIATAIFAVASLTDWLDGYIARRYNLISNFGKIMDPIADKFLTLAAFFVFAQLNIIPLWMTVLIAVREIGLTLLRFRAMKHGKVLAAEKLGKYKTVLQMLSIVVILLLLVVRALPDGSSSFAVLLSYDQYIIMTLMGLTLFLTLYSGATNFIQNRKAYGF